MKAIILAGGSGERFWPLSNSKTPKQFLKLFSDKTLIRETYERMRYKMEPTDIFIITAEKYQQLTMKEIPEIPKENIILEPIPRNTAPACMLGTQIAQDDEIVVILPADHYIPDKSKFWDTLSEAIQGAQKYDGLFTLGITPTRPETGYGYIEAGKAINNSTYKVNSFKEKPDPEKAKIFLSKGNYYWNSGMFIWKKSTFLEQMKKHSPGIYNQLINITPWDTESLRKIMPNIEKISIDYALLERSDKVYVVKADFVWSDVGNWVSVRELQGYSDNDENVEVIDGKNVFVKSDKFVGIIGLSNIIVVEGENGILIAKEENSQDVRKISENLKKIGKF
ncbi:MAG TPA: mannose-1-phosphate guanylyltransferase [Petrotoga sp.]|nr:MAG: Mannose-1-phosphate guanylyltransferase (GDP) [Petrotoga mobilis]HBT51275.1 mannose-1-phosphate guanylyltransferase [Petrotoga sp.]